jgi:hypothetical protein
MFDRMVSTRLKEEINEKKMKKNTEKVGKNS